ncbi:Uridine kinase [Actinomyces ruminicola]|uniref:Uridine kinase n=1 Tax=Actinomyces ruminicola TaxID=332524 RepID=A0A1H0AZZ1_9ACTO|nr:hypothetical protein [Actinomyces ruminicola]SDN39022.1 Uridine kinase [Actinomyces ruminicola]
MPGLHGIRLQPEEPAVRSWSVTALATLFRYVLNRAGTPTGRPAVVAVDGRSGSGKTTLTRRLAALEPGAQTLHIDDLDWNEPLYQWDHLLVEVLTRLRADGALEFTPPAWPRHGRAGAISITVGAPLVLVEGTGAGMRAVADLVDVHLWVQTDYAVAEERGIGRDIADGTNGDAEESVRFWHDWQAAERPFFAADRPWERADAVVCGQALPGVGPDEVAWTELP